MSLMKGHLAVRLYSQLPLKYWNRRRPGVGLHPHPPHCCHVIAWLTAQYSPGARISKKLLPTLKSIFIFFCFGFSLCACIWEYQKKLTNYNVRPTVLYIVTSRLCRATTTILSLPLQPIHSSSQKKYLTKPVFAWFILILNTVFQCNQWLKYEGEKQKTPFAPVTYPSWSLNSPQLWSHVN